MILKQGIIALIQFFLKKTGPAHTPWKSFSAFAIISPGIGVSKT